MLKVGVIKLIIKYTKLLVVAFALLVPIYLFGQTKEQVDTPVTTEPTVVMEEVSKPIDLYTLTAEQLVDHFAELYGADPILAKRIIEAESGWQRTVKNPNSSASGYFQFINGTWYWTMERMGLPVNTDKHDHVISIQAGVWLLAEDGVAPWLESKHRWAF